MSHGDCIEDVEYLEKLIRERFGIERFLVNYVGPTIGAHSGPGTLALFFVGEPR
ncbi:DegV family protein [Laedolimicola sp.]|uniref:DegV family protein n=1 Tax=Laedolimicola sp. TaxID=2981663 RepID=UPI003F7DA48C